MGTEKKSKSGSELPKGSAAPSCKLSALFLPRTLLLSGGSPKAVLSSPRAGRCLWVSQGHPITAAAASLGEGAASKAGAPVPLPRGQGGRERAAARPGDPRERGDPARLALRLWRRARQSGTPGEGWGGGQKPAGMGTPAGLAALSPRHGCWGSGGSGGSGALCDGGWQAARIRARVRVCSLCPGEDRSDFRGRLGSLTEPLHGCSPTDVTQGGSGQISGVHGHPGEPLEHSQESMSPPGHECVSMGTPVRECCPPHSIPCVSPPQHHHPKRMGAPAAVHQPPPPVPPTQLPAASFPFFFHSLKLKKTKIKRKKYYLFFLRVNPLIIFTFIYSCCFIKKLPLYFFKKPLLSFFFFLSLRVSLFTVSVYFLHCHR